MTEILTEQEETAARSELTEALMIAKLERWLAK